MRSTAPAVDSLKYSPLWAGRRPTYALRVKLRVSARLAPIYLGTLGVVGVLAYAFGGFRWLDFVALAGTAVGTLGLAFYTYGLAHASQRQVEISEAHLDAAEATTIEAARARIDAMSPLLGLTVSLEGVMIGGTLNGAPRGLSDREDWSEDELDEVRMSATLKIALVNYGHSPAHVFFPSMDPDPSELLARSFGSRYLMIPPGDRYADALVIRLTGREAADGRACEFVVTCDAAIHGSVFDTLRWLGTLQPLRVEDGHAKRNKQIPLNAGGASIVREYPILDRPAEMRALAERIRLGK